MEPSDVTLLLHKVRQGKPEAANELMPLVYKKLRSLAGEFFKRETPGHTLQPTALVHEAYLRLVDQERADYNDRTHFFAVAATVMRRILVDHARHRSRQKRGGEQQRVPLDELVAATEARGVDLIALDQCLHGLGEIDPRKARVVELRFFGGFSVDEVANLLGLSPKTVKREWAAAKGWLFRELSSPARSDEVILGEG